MYEDYLEEFEELILKREHLGVSEDEDHWINDKIKDCQNYLNRHL